MKIYCCGCEKDVEARITNGGEIYPTRLDLKYKLLFVCDDCGNYVGTHEDSEKPLGCIPTKEIRQKRMLIHDILDPLWKQKRITRQYLYQKLARKLQVKEYHTADIKSVEEANKVIAVAELLREELKDVVIV